MNADPASPSPPRPPDGAAEALAKARQRDSLDLVVEVVEYRYREERSKWQQRFVTVVIAVLSLGAAITGIYIQSIVSSIRSEVREGRDEIEEATADGIALIDAQLEQAKAREYVRSPPSTSQ